MTNTISGSINGNAATVSTINGLAPNTATTQATQGNITSLGKLTSLNVGGATHYMEVKTDGEINLHGNARVVKDLSISAADWCLVYSPPSLTATSIFAALEFDEVSDDVMHYSLIIPSDWDPATDIEFVVDWIASAGEDNGTVCWGLEYLGKKDGENISGGSTFISQVSAGNHTESFVVRTTFTSKILASNLEAGDLLGLKLRRDVSEDTLDGGCHLINTHLRYTTNKLGEAL